MRRKTRRFTTVLVAAAVLALAPLGMPSATAHEAGPDFGHARVVATFPSGPAGSFAESMAADGHGGLIVSVTTWGPEDSSPDGYAPNTGQLWRIRPDGSKVKFGPSIRLSEYGQLVGVAVDSHHRVYVGRYNFGAEYYSLTTESPPSGVLRVTKHGAYPIMKLPLLAWPNGLEIHGRTMYVTDSWLGAVWRGSTTRHTAPAQPWFTSKLLAPGTIGIGANGIAYRHHALYVTAYDLGSIVKVPIRDHGVPGKGKVLVTDQRLVTADGIAFGHDRLWVTVNGQYDEDYNLVAPPALMVVDHHGRVVSASTPEGSLDYPTDVVLRHHHHHDSVAVANGSFVNGTPNVTVFRK